jgi:hypothetical protein
MALNGSRILEMVVATTLSSLNVLLLGAAGAVVWNQAMSVDEKVKEATATYQAQGKSLTETANYAKAAVVVLEKEMYSIKLENKDLSDAVKELTFAIKHSRHVDVISLLTETESPLMMALPPEEPENLSLDEEDLFAPEGDDEEIVTLDGDGEDLMGGLEEDLGGIEEEPEPLLAEEPAPEAVTESATFIESFQERPEPQSSPEPLPEQGMDRQFIQKQLPQMNTYNLPDQ